MTNRGHINFISNRMDTEICEDGNFINYSDPPSLQTIATVSIAVQLWGEVDLKLCRKFYDYNLTNYKKQEEVVRQKLDLVPLPNSLKTAVSDIIRHIGVQWLKCITDFDEYTDLEELRRKVRISYHFTMEGKFDKVQLLKEAVRCTINLSPTDKDFCSLYKLACYYCLDECTIADLRPETWNISALKTFYIDIEDYLVAYWTAYLEGNLNDLLPILKSFDYRNIHDCNLSISANMVSLSVFLGNLTALKYFWRTLSSEEVNSNVERWLAIAIDECKTRNRYVCRYSYDKLGRILSYFKEFYAPTDIMCFLLSHMNCLKQKEAFKTHSETIVDSLLFHWPLQRFLIPTMAVAVNYLKEEQYVQIISKLIDFINEKMATCAQLREIWCLSPLKLRKSFICFLERDATALIRLMTVGDEVAIDLILQDGTVDQQTHIMFRMIKETAFYSFVWSDEFDISMIDFLASKFLPSDSNVVLFKQKVALEYAVTVIYRQNFDLADKLLNWAFQSPQEIKSFKLEHINPRDAYGVIVYTTGAREFVDNFLNWYFDTEEEVSIFKSNFC